MSDGLKWVKATKSGGSGGQCVEVAATAGRTYVRDTKRREAGYLAVDAGTWRAFVAAVKNGAYDPRLAPALTGGRRHPRFGKPNLCV